MAAPMDCESGTAFKASGGGSTWPADAELGKALRIERGGARGFTLAVRVA